MSEGEGRRGASMSEGGGASSARSFQQLYGLQSRAPACRVI